MQEYTSGRFVVRIRQCKEGERELIYEIMKENMETYFNRFTEEGWSRSRFISGFDPSRIRTVYCDGTPIAFYDTELTDRFGEKCLYVHNVQIKEGYRGVLGLLILRLVERDAKSKGARKLRCKTFIANESASKLLERLGWKKVTSHETETREKSYVFEKTL